MDDDDAVEVPGYFMCPISLQIMKDPVTVITGITYDRHTIEHWLSTAEDALCPVTKQPLPPHSDLTPNHTLRRLIQAWCVTHANHGVDRIPTPKPPLSKSHLLKLLRDLKSPELYVNSLHELHLLANENEKTRKCLAETGAADAMVSLMIKSFKESLTVDSVGLGQVLKILHATWLTDPNKTNRIVKENDHEFIDSLLWVLRSVEGNLVEVKTIAMLVLSLVTDAASTKVLERLKIGFFNQTVNVIRQRISAKAVKAALRVLIDVCPHGRNRMKMVEAGGVFELVELELGHGSSEKNLSELAFCLLAHLCACADGRAQLINHAAGIAVVAKRMLRVSPGTDDRAVQILGSIGKFSATDEVLAEMLRVGAVMKLYMLLHAHSTDYIKKKAKEILRLHSNAWSNSTCIL